MITGEDIYESLVALHPNVQERRWAWLEMNLCEELYDVTGCNYRRATNMKRYNIIAEYGNRCIREVYKSFEGHYEVAYSLDDEIAKFPNIMLAYFLALLYKEYMPVKTNVIINVSGENIMRKVFEIQREIQTAARSFTNVENVRVICPTS